MLSHIPPLHREGYPFVVLGAIATLLLYMLSDTLGCLALLATLFCAWFFRNPVRIIPEGEALIVSPADGVVQSITDVQPPEELELGETPRTRVSIFLNVFNVHVNRIPAAGEVTHLHYHEGAFFNASLDKASEENERQLVRIQLPEDGGDLGVVQIAGLIARRIVCHLKEGQTVETGEEFGIIRFGSRVDLYLPEGVSPKVLEGQTMIGGESVIAEIKAKRPAKPKPVSRTKKERKTKSKDADAEQEDAA